MPLKKIKSGFWKLEWTAVLQNLLTGKNFAKRLKNFFNLKTLLFKCALSMWRSSPAWTNFYLLRLMPSLFILASRVVGFSPRIFAAPFSPLTLHPVISSTSEIWALSTSSSDTAWDAVVKLFFSISQSPSSSCFPRLMMTALSTMFSSSRILPGQLYATKASMVFWEMASIFFPVLPEYFFTKCFTSSGISSFRSRSGGISMGNTLSR